MSHPRREFQKGSLTRENLDPSPFLQFGVWYDEAETAGVFEPHAVILATADARGRPSARVVLVRGWTGAGFEFFTNYESAKGKALDANPQAELLFYWMEMERQIRIQGTVERLTDEENRAYFEKRPRGSRLSAYASPQSAEVESREWLEEEVRRLETEHAGDEPRTPPPYWGGFRVMPDTFEFWQGRESRLHDRFQYRMNGDDGWDIVRLGP
ncbi:MAG: pyridoxamine 5'-phosphate oxidase [Planctomycetota bacterium]